MTYLIIQGPTDYLDETNLLEYPNKVISTWVGQKYYNEGIYSELPRNYGPQNINLQKISTLNGLLRAKELGATSAIKIRSDISITPLNGVELLSEERISFLCYHNYHGGYYVDYMMGGPIDDMIKLWTFDVNNEFPERQIYNNYNKLFNKSPQFVLGALAQTSKIFWHKNSKLINDYLSDPLMLLHEP